MRMYCECVCVCTDPRQMWEIVIVNVAPLTTPSISLSLNYLPHGAQPSDSLSFSL